MIVGIASDKGGVGKTTTAINIAVCLARTGEPTVLLDGDRTRIATNWEKRARKNGAKLPFDVHPIEAAAMVSHKYAHKVIDTGQQPGENDLLMLAQYSDILIVPTAPAAFDVDGLGQTIRALRTIERPDGSPVDFRVLFTRVEHHQQNEVQGVRRMLEDGCVATFAADVPELKAFKRAAARGVLVDAIKDDENAPRAWQAYEAIGEELLHGTR